MPVQQWSKIALVCSVLMAQPVRGQEATVYGQVVLADGARVEIVRARIAISGVEAEVASFSDDHGLFQVAAPGAASLIVAKAGFLPVTLRVADTASTPSTPATVRLTRAASISGRLVDSMNEPVVGGGVRMWRTDDGVMPGNRAVITVFSNDLGEFRVGGLAAGKYEITSYHDFDEQARIRTNDETFGSRLPSNARAIGEALTIAGVTPVEISTGADVQVTLIQASPSPRQGLRGSAAIAGTVVDAFGEPVELVRVRAWRTSGSDRIPAQQTGAAAISDDRGHFRLFHLPPGTYVVEVLPAKQPPNAPAMGPSYSPGTNRVSQASLISVDAGQATSNVTIEYTASALPNLHGIAVNAAGQPIRGIVGLMATSAGNGVRLGARTTQTAADGSFTFSSVAPGEYVVRATVLRSENPRVPAEIISAEFGLQRVSVDDVDVGPVRLKTSPTAKLLGRIEFEGTPPSTPADFTIRALSIDPERTPDRPSFVTSTASPDNDWSFVIKGLVGMTLVDMDRAPTGWWLKSIHTPIPQAAGEPFDVSNDGEVVLVLSNSSAAVSGRVLPYNAIGGNPLVIAFSTDEERWRNGSSYIRYVRARPQDRTFQMHSLPPGDYFLVAVANADTMPEDGELTGLLQALAPLSKRIKLLSGDAQGYEVAPVVLRR